MTSKSSDSNVLAVDTETTGVSFYDEAFGASVADDVGSTWFELPAQAVELHDLLGGKCLIFHNAKFDLQKLQLAGVLDRRDRPVFHDTEGLHHLLSPGEPKRLKVLARELLGVGTAEEEALNSYCRKKKNGIDKKRDGLSKVPREILVPYAVKDAEYTYQLYLSLWPKVQRDDSLRGLYDLERRLTWTLLDMEWAGLGVSLAYAEREAKTLNGAILDARLRAIDEADKVGYTSPKGETFNPGSNAQIKEYFHSKGVKKQKYDKHTLPLIDDPMAQALLDMRGPKKMVDYLDALQDEQRDGILHPNFKQYVPATGRMSSGKAER